MRSSFRSLTFGLAATLGVAAMAQQPYTILLNGIVLGCTPGQTVNVQTVQGTQPAYNFDVTVDANCGWSASLAVASNPAWWLVSTGCNGAIVSASGDETFNFFNDSVLVSVTLDCGGGGQVDCLGTPGGGALPGTPCDDGDPNTSDDTWSADCQCVGNPLGNAYDCLGILNGPNVPGSWCVTFMGDTGIWSPNCLCETNGIDWDCLGIPNGPNQPGTACVVPGTNVAGTWSLQCVCEPDSNSTWTDCLGVTNGSALPGTACDDGDPNTENDYWSADCQCVGNPLGNSYDCLGVLNGPDMPGTMCVTLLGDTGVWSPNCACETNSNNTYDCLGVLNGTNLPGTPCQAFGVVGTWTADCQCLPDNNDPCNADFWVMQAWGPDSVPVPYELWVWNLSTGGNGVFSYLWDFGDGTTSTGAFPSHTYADNGPYVLCLTIYDNNGCTDTHCDSISIDEDGMYSGVMGGGGDRQDGFTLNVQQQVSTAVQEVNITGSIATWPNPAVDELNVAVAGEMTGAVQITVTDLEGRLVMTERASFSGDRNQLTLPTSELGAGLYLLRISDGTNHLSQRFVKAN